MQFAFSLYQARKTHFEENMFKNLPKKLNFMDLDPIPDQYSKWIIFWLFDLVTQPNLDQMVFCRILGQIDGVYAVLPHI